MSVQARYVHTNLIAQDWRKLAQFYQQVFGCEPLQPERDLSGEWIERGTSIPGVRIRGMHLRLPGYGAEGPTLEVFQYNTEQDKPPTAANRPGYGHIAFAVDDVPRALEAVIAAGGGALGEIVSAGIPGASRVTFVYAKDPEGNLIELQQWSPVED